MPDRGRNNICTQFLQSRHYIKKNLVHLIHTPSMSDVTPTNLPRIKAYQLPGLPLSPDFIHPDYQGGSILNLPSSICQSLGAEPLGAVPLRPELIVTTSTNVRRVILVLVDALSLAPLAALDV